MLQVNIASAVELTDQQKKKLEQALADQYSSDKLLFNYQLKTELIAGLQLSVAGKLYDASLKTRLNQLASKI